MVILINRKIFINKFVSSNIVSSSNRWRSSGIINNNNNNIYCSRGINFGKVGRLVTVRNQYYNFERGLVNIRMLKSDSLVIKGSEGEVGKSKPSQVSSLIEEGTEQSQQQQQSKLDKAERKKLKKEKNKLRKELRKELKKDTQTTNTNLTKQNHTNTPNLTKKYNHTNSPNPTKKTNHTKKNKRKYEGTIEEYEGTIKGYECPLVILDRQRQQDRLRILDYLTQFKPQPINSNLNQLNAKGITSLLLKTTTNHSSSNNNILTSSNKLTRQYHQLTSSHFNNNQLNSLEALDTELLMTSPFIPDIPTETELCNMQYITSSSASPWFKPGSTGVMKRKPLLVSDLNGVLVFRKKKHPYPRPYLKEFLDFVFDNFHVAVWSSARRENVDLIVNRTFQSHRSHLLLSWSREQCDLDGHFNSKCDSVKDLRNLWRRLRHYPGVLGAPFGPHNTIILDDSPTKIRHQPENQILIPEYGDIDPTDQELFKLTQYLSLLVAEFQKDPDPTSYDVRTFLSHLNLAEYRPNLSPLLPL